ncbi:MAG TPA: hypothetical protein VF247_10315 [Candidatus Krumholzibacteria bacterium]
MIKAITATERRYEEMLMALSAGERLAMAGDMLASARKLVVAGLSPEQAANPRLVRRHLFMSFYGNDLDPTKRDRILELIESGQ